MLKHPRSVGLDDDSFIINDVFINDLNWFNDHCLDRNKLITNGFLSCYNSFIIMEQFADKYSYNFEIYSLINYSFVRTNNQMKSVSSVKSSYPVTNGMFLPVFGRCMSYCPINSVDNFELFNRKFVDVMDLVYVADPTNTKCVLNVAKTISYCGLFERVGFGLFKEAGTESDGLIYPIFAIDDNFIVYNYEDGYRYVEMNNGDSCFVFDNTTDLRLSSNTHRICNVEKSVMDSIFRMETVV